MSLRRYINKRIVLYSNIVVKKYKMELQISQAHKWNTKQNWGKHIGTRKKTITTVEAEKNLRQRSLKDIVRDPFLCHD